MFIGIDFGTTNTVVARMRPEDAQPTLIRFGAEDVVPSLVAYDGERLRFGREAIDQEGLIIGLKNLLRDHKGRGKPVARFPAADGATRDLPLSDVMTAWFVWLKAAIVADLAGRDLAVPDRLPLVVTVPQNCHDSQRRATRTAAVVAGFEVVDILNEPTAAALSIGLSGITAQVPVGRNVCVYDFGGGTFDASLIARTGEHRFREVDSEGVQQCGGGDIDQTLANLLTQRLWANKGVAKSGWAPDAGQLARLRRQAEKAKIALSSDPELEVVPVTLANVIGTRSTFAVLRKVQVQLERADVAAAAEPPIRRTRKALEALLERQPQAARQLAAVVLTGGSSGLPGVAERVRKLLDKHELQDVKLIVSDRRMHDVAMGAAVFATVAGGGDETLINRLAALHVGVWRIEHGREWFHVLLPRGAELPSAGGSELVTRYRYRPVHDIGEFRFCQCSDLLDGAGNPIPPGAIGDAAVRRDLRPAGDVLEYPRALRIAFNPELADFDAEALDARRIRDTDPGLDVEEIYRFRADGLIDISVAVGGRDVPLTLDFQRSHDR